MTEPFNIETIMGCTVVRWKSNPELGYVKGTLCRQPAKLRDYRLFKIAECDEHYFEYSKTVIQRGSRQTSQCNKCKEYKPTSEFRIARRYTSPKDHHYQTSFDVPRSRCKVCEKEDSSDYYNRNKEELSKRSLKYYQANQKYRLEYQREYQKLHGKKKAPEVRRAQASRRRAKKKVAMSKEDRTLSVAYRKAIKQDQCFYCGQRTEAMHDDHFFPLAKGGTDHWWNLRRSCASCNLAKGAHCGTYFLLKQ